MGLFDFFRPRTTRGTPSLVPFVRACVERGTPTEQQRLYRMLLSHPVLVMLNQRVPGLPVGALLNPKSGVRVEFVTTLHPVTGARVVPVFTDEATLMARFTPHAATQRGTIPYVGFLGRDLLPLLGSHGIELFSGSHAYYLDADSLKGLMSLK